MESVLSTILVCQNAKVIKKVEAGWSRDLKYYVLAEDNQEYMLRISDANLYDEKREEFERLKRLNELDFLMSMALEFGRCENERFVYMLLTWVRGESLNQIISNLNSEQQFELGRQAGQILRKIHSINVEEMHDVATVKSTILQKLIRYENCGYRVPSDEVALEYIKAHVDELDGLKTVMNHGDFHVGNLILTPEGKIGVIDFNRMKISDGIEEFYKVQSFDIEVSILFSIGQIRGYFNGEPPAKFWRVLALYNAYAALNSIAWATKFGEDEVKGMIRRCEKTFEDYDQFNRMIPHWYEEGVSS